MNFRIYFLSFIQLLLLVLLIGNLYSILPLIPPDVYLWIIVIGVSFPAITFILLISIYEVYRTVRLPI